MNNIPFRSVSLENGGPNPDTDIQGINNIADTESKVDSILEGGPKYILPKNRDINHFKAGDMIWYFESHFHPDMRPCPELDEQMEYLEGIVKEITGSRVIISGKNGKPISCDYRSIDIFTMSDICNLYENNAVSELASNNPLDKMQIIKLNLKIKEVLKECESLGVSIGQFFEAKTKAQDMLANKPKRRL